MANGCTNPQTMAAMGIAQNLKEEEEENVIVAEEQINVGASRAGAS